MTVRSLENLLHYTTGWTHNDSDQVMINVVMLTGEERKTLARKSLGEFFLCTLQ